MKANYFTILYWFCHTSTWIRHERVYTCPPSWIPLPPPSPYHPSGSSQCTSPEHPVSCIEPGLAIRFLYEIIHVSMPFPQIISPLPTESKRLFYTSVSIFLSRIQGYRYHLSKFHIYTLVYCIGVSFVLKIRTPGSPNPRDTTSKSHSVLLGKERNVIFFFFFPKLTWGFWCLWSSDAGENHWSNSNPSFSDKGIET